jgi:hypothetical protein
MEYSSVQFFLRISLAMSFSLYIWIFIVSKLYEIDLSCLSAFLGDGLKQMTDQIMEGSQILLSYMEWHPSLKLTVAKLVNSSP